MREFKFGMTTLASTVDYYTTLTEDCSFLHMNCTYLTEIPAPASTIIFFLPLKRLATESITSGIVELWSRANGGSALINLGLVLLLFVTAFDCVGLAFVLILPLLSLVLPTAFSFFSTFFFFFFNGLVAAEEPWLLFVFFVVVVLVCLRADTAFLTTLGGTEASSSRYLLGMLTSRFARFMIVVGCCCCEMDLFICSTADQTVNIGNLDTVRFITVYCNTAR